MRRDPHFRAEIQIHEIERGCPRQEFFYFPKSGERNEPLGMPGVEGYNTVKLCYQPETRVSNGSTFVAGCLLITEEPYLQVMAPGSSSNSGTGVSLSPVQCSRCSPRIGSMHLAYRILPFRSDAVSGTCMIECERHGPQPATFICQHIAQSLISHEPVGFHWPPDSDQEYPDA